MSLIIPIDDELTLRLLEPQHAEEIYAVADANREHIGQWMPWVAVTRSAADSRAYAERALRDFAERRQMHMAMVYRGRIVGGTGWVDWKDYSTSGMNVTGATADIGYWVAADLQGRGIVTRSVRAMIDLAFREYQMHRLTIRAEPQNRRSCAVALRLGFRHEGTLRHVCRWNDRWIDHNLYALLAEEWRGRGQS